MAVPALPKDYLILRVTWLCWLASLLGWFALPAFFMYVVDGAEIELITEWSYGWDNASICIALLLAALAPPLVHRFDPRRRTPTFRSERLPGGREDYRSPPVLTTSVDTRAFSANVRVFSRRLAAAMTLSAFACCGLWGPVFWVQQHSCIVWPNEFCFNEYIVYLVALLGVVLIHAPTWRKVFGSAAPC